jgi:hypothetical protein
MDFAGTSRPATHSAARWRKAGIMALARATSSSPDGIELSSEIAAALAMSGLSSGTTLDSRNA